MDDGEVNKPPGRRNSHEEQNMCDQLADAMSYSASRESGVIECVQG